MIQIYKYDENYVLIKPILLYKNKDGEYDIPKNCTTIAPPKNPSFYKATFDVENKRWYESATQEYIESMQPAPEPPSDIELLKQQNADLLQQLAESEKRAEEQSKTTAELVMLLTEKGVI